MQILSHGMHYFIFIGATKKTPLQLQQFLIKPLNGETHHIVKRSFYLRNGNISNPLLHAISTGFIERAIIGYIITDIFFTQ